MALGDYLAGFAWFAGTWGGAGYVAATVERRRLPRLDPAPRALALGLLFFSALIAVHVLPGAFGLLSPAAVTVTALAAAGLVSRLRPGATARERAPTPPAAREGDGPSAALAWVAVIGVGGFALAALWAVRLAPPTHVDALSFALPGVAHWIHTDSIWDVGSFLPLLQVRTYPNNGDVLALAAILPWHSDAFLRLLPLPLLGLSGLGVFAIGRELGARIATAALLGSAAVATKVVVVPALYDLKPDTFMYATFVAGVLFLLRHARTGARTDLVLAGLGLGLAFGSRWYGITSVVVVLAVWVVSLLLARRRARTVLRDAAVLCAALLAGGGFWLVRNLALTGNPLYPVKVHLLGATLLDAPRDILTERFGFTIADRLDQPGFVADQLLPALRSALGLPGALVLLGLVLTAILALRGKRGVGDKRLVAVWAGASALAVVYAFLPAGAQGLPGAPVPGIVAENVRWLVPAFLLAAGATAAAASRLQRGATLGVEAAALVCALAAASSSFSAGAGRVAAAALILALAALLAPRARRAADGLFRPAGRRAAALAAGLAALAVTGYVHEHRYSELRYAGRSAAVDWIDAHARSGRRVGVAGYWSASAFVPIYALFGPRLGNDVGYVGALVRDQLRVFHEPARFKRALRRGRYELLAVGRLEAPDLSGERAQRTLSVPPEERWAQSAGFVEVARDGAFVLLARRGAASGTPG